MDTIEHYSMRSGKTLLKEMWFWKWAGGASFCRMPEAMSTLALINLGIGLKNYSLGAFLVSIYTFTTAIGAVFLGRYFDRNRRPRLFILGLSGLSVVIHFLLGLSPYLSFSLLGIYSAVCVAALLPSGLPGEARAIISRLPGSKDIKRRILIIDAILTEIAWIAGPALVSLLSFTGIDSSGVFLMGFCFVMVFLLLPALEPVKRKKIIDKPENPLKQFIKYSASWPSFADSFALGAIETGIIAALPLLLDILGISSHWAGFIISGLAGTSIIGGVIFVRIQRRNLRWNNDVHNSYVERIFLFLICLCSIFASLAISPFMTITSTLVAGFFIAPLNALRSMSIEQYLPYSLQSQGFSLQFSLYSLGACLGTTTIAYFQSPLMSMLINIIFVAAVSSLGIFVMTIFR